MIFRNREGAAVLLLKYLEKYKGSDGIVLAVPRGGVPLGNRIARELNLPLDIILSKKIGHPTNPEYAVGWVTEKDAFFRHDTGVPEKYFQEEAIRIRNELHKRNRLFRGDKPEPVLSGKIVMLIDDGIATGNTLEACIESVRIEGPEKIVVAVPVVPPSAATRFRKLADEFICLYEPDDFRGVGQFYADFGQVSDEEVLHLLNE